MSASVEEIESHQIWGADESFILVSGVGRSPNPLFHQALLGFKSSRWAAYTRLESPYKSKENQKTL
ncbi:MAG: hypothetical protein AAGG51_22235 [Cyanobacteria bacterium P01_G01_bin.54]